MSKGKYISITKDLLEKNSVLEIRLIQDVFRLTIPSNVEHKMVFLEDSVFINLVNGDREYQTYDMTHTLKYELVNKTSFLTTF